MKLEPACSGRVAALIERGVDIPNPLSLDIGAEVDPGRISGRGVKIYPGCRIYGADTAIGPGSQIGREGPVTIESCRLGAEVELKGGYFKSSVFLDNVSMGLGAHVREGCLLEEHASGAHCVGLKQTILFPFVTLGSLINFCDVFMAGGTSRKDHSEVGSSYIHFNFTPDGDKATASLIGDVPRGVMLDRRSIFLGGQGGLVGPVRLGFGNVIAAGGVLRSDVLEEDKLVVGKSHRGAVVDFTPRAYGGLARVVKNNLLYVANLAALREWYLHVRRPFFEARELGKPVFEGALDVLRAARKERLGRFEALAGYVAESLEGREKGSRAERKRELVGRIGEVCAVFGDEDAAAHGPKKRERFLSALAGRAGGDGGGNYLEVIRDLPPDVSSLGTSWLDEVVGGLFRRAAEKLPSMELAKE